MLPVPAGFKFAVAGAGFKKPGRNDLAVLLSESDCTAAGVFTQNLFPAAPVLVARETLAEAHHVRGVVVNAGQANACTGEEGLADCRVALEMTAKALGVAPDTLLPASTGVIGQRLKLDLWRAALPQLAESLGKTEPVGFARAIMTTDTFPKLAWGSIQGAGGTARLMGMAKGAGMICPNMATMLAFVATDARVDPAILQASLRRAVDASFNRVTVDGDTSTNDCLILLANGHSGLDIDEGGADAFVQALTELCQALAYQLVEDAEGGSKIMRVRVAGAADDHEAELAARAVGHSPLVKTAMYGRDANWGRIAAALGRSGAAFTPEEVSIQIGGVVVFEGGRAVPGDLDGLLASVMRRTEVAVDVVLGQGPGNYELLAADLTHEYVSINADYRS